jgi:hypothetical protein
MNAHQFGINLACVNAGITPLAFEFHKSAVEYRENPTTPGYGVFERGLAKFAAEMYAHCGQQDSIEYHVFDQLTKSATWYPQFNAYTDPVLETLGAALGEAVGQDHALQARVKSAGLHQGLIGALGERALSWSPSLLQGLLAASAATGAGIGSIYWALNRHSTEDDADNEATQAKINHYSKLTKQISNRLQDTNALAPAAGAPVLA